MSKAIIKDEIILNIVYELRGQKVMLDKDLALLFDVKPIRLREQVKRNQKKFLSHFMFQLTEEEVNLMVSQNAIPSKQSLGGYLPMYLQSMVFYKLQMYYKVIEQ